MRRFHIVVGLLALAAICFAQRGRPPQKFTTEEKAKFVLLNERVNRNYSEFQHAARRELKLNHDRLPARGTLIHWTETFEKTGCVEKRYGPRDA
jgi:hypothetical protein